MHGKIECAFIGVIGRDPQFKLVRDGELELLSFSVAVGKDESTQWLNVAAFGERAKELHGIAEKGQRVYCEGSIRLNEYEDRDGKWRAGLSVAANKVEILGAIGRRRPKQKKAESAPPAETQRHDLDDAIPF